MSLIKTDSAIAESKLKEFLIEWPIERVKKMKLSDYTDVGNTNTFTYWIEFGTKELGLISGSPSNKFEIWKQLNPKPSESNKYKEDGTYKWKLSLGDTAEEVFQKVRSAIIKTIEYAKIGKFSEIEKVKLHSLSKWKIAFLYSDKKILPVYNYATLKEMGRILHCPNSANASRAELHKFILERRESNEDFFQFTSKYYLLAVDVGNISVISNTNYYIIGSKYQNEDDNSFIDIFPDMVKKGVISTGYFWDYDFSHLIGKEYEEISNWIEQNIPHTEERYTTAKKALASFLTIKSGDLIAIKSQGRFGNLTIIGYAVAKEVNGEIYRSNDFELGHTMFVDFIETGIKKETGLSYGLTIHKINPGDREGHFEKIFGSYCNLFKPKYHLPESTINKKTEDSHVRKSIGEQVVSQVHSQIQNSFFDYLQKEYGRNVSYEESRVDIIRRNENKVYFYEVKPFNSAFKCIREGIGQLLDYAYSSFEKNIHIIIVGVAHPEEKDLEFIEYIKSNINIPFNYECFDMRSVISKIH